MRGENCIGDLRSCICTGDLKSRACTGNKKNGDTTRNTRRRNCSGNSRNELGFGENSCGVYTNNSAALLSLPALCRLDARLRVWLDGCILMYLLKAVVFRELSRNITVEIAVPASHEEYSFSRSFVNDDEIFRLAIRKAFLSLLVPI